MKILWIFLGGHHKIGLYLGIISMHFVSFLKAKVQNSGYILWGCKNFKYFFGELEIPDTFGGWTVDAGPESSNGCHYGLKIF